MNPQSQERTKRHKEKKLRHHLKVVNEWVQSNGRQCGECTVCCNIMEVEAVNKPRFTDCQHQCATGCAIYERRPRACKAWACLWRLGKALGDLTCPEDARPDQCGLMLDLRKRQEKELSGLVDPSVTNIVMAYELETDAAKRNADILDKLVKKLPVIVITPGRDVYLWRMEDVGLRMYWDNVIP